MFSGAVRASCPRVCPIADVLPAHSVHSIDLVYSLCQGANNEKKDSDDRGDAGFVIVWMG